MRSILRRLSPLLPVAALLALPGAPARAVDIDWVTVGDPGNPPDDEVMSCCRESIGLTGFGSVDYVYEISRTEITWAQWAEFLNAVADADPNGLYNARMGPALGFANAITQTGSPGSYSYAVTPGREDRPVGYIDFYDALRFANWLHNGQPTGAQDATTTEDGAYTLLGANPADVARNPDAVVALTSEDEWYKAAFWDPFEQGYFDFATGFNPSETLPECAGQDGDCVPVPEPPPGGLDRVSANFCPPQVDPPVSITCPSVWPATTGPGEAVDVGSYTSSESPNGTFDQSGNHFEWTEGMNDDDLGLEIRVIRGGSWARGLNDLRSLNRAPVNPNSQVGDAFGFRVSRVPEPVGGPLVALGVVLGLARRRSRAGA